MVRIEDKSRCCGCTACQAVCPHDAIVMKADPLGFRYPEVNLDLCVDCGLCERVCTFGESPQPTSPEVYAARHIDPAEVLSSTSGSAFTALSDYILEAGGVVYGAAFEGHFHVAHIRAEDKQTRDRQRRSKYVQSDMDGIFRQVLSDLKTGRTVLFSGTPCQTAALRSYIPEKLQEKLYLMDIVCHGVPSPAVWESYVAWQEAKEGAKADEIIFRDKDFGWRSSVESFVYAGRKVSSRSYSYLYYRNIMMRESCGSCPYADVSRPSDITIADYWRKDKTCPDFADDNKGCSLLMCNSAKGKDLFARIAGSLNVEKAVLAGCIQPNMENPTKLHRSRHAFAKEFGACGIDHVLRKYGDLGWRYRLESFVKSVYQAVRQTVRKMLGRR